MAYVNMDSPEKSFLAYGNGLDLHFPSLSFSQSVCVSLHGAYKREWGKRVEMEQRLLLKGVTANRWTHDKKIKHTSLVNPLPSQALLL